VKWQVGLRLLQYIIGENASRFRGRAKEQCFEKSKEKRQNICGICLCGYEFFCRRFFPKKVLVVKIYVYICIFNLMTMSTISLEIDELVFEETEKIPLTSNKPRNGYVNGTLNHIQKRLLLEKILQKESKAVYVSSMEVLKEFESIDNELQTI
jgi:hypothetical protein